LDLNRQNIVIDGKVVVATGIPARIYDQAIISGPMTKKKGRAYRRDAGAKDPERGALDYSGRFVEL
jgi:hypothetical protein